MSEANLVQADANTEVPEAAVERVTDLLLDFGQEFMPASSHLLCLASPVFTRMLESGMQEAQQRVIKVEVASKEEFAMFYDLLKPMAFHSDRVTEANVDSLLSISVLPSGNHQGSLRAALASSSANWHPPLASSTVRSQHTTPEVHA